MPPKTSLFSGSKKRKAENDLTDNTPPFSVSKPYVPPVFGSSKPSYAPPISGSAKPYTPPIFGSSPASSQDSSKRLRLNYTPKPVPVAPTYAPKSAPVVPNPAPNPFGRGNVGRGGTTLHTPPKVSLFTKSSKTSQIPSGSDGTPKSSQSSAASTSPSTLHTPPKISLFIKKKAIPQTDGNNSTPNTSQNSQNSSYNSRHNSSQNGRQSDSQYPNPFRKIYHPEDEPSRALNSSPKTGNKLRLNIGHGSTSQSGASRSGTPMSTPLNSQPFEESFDDLATLLEAYEEPVFNPWAAVVFTSFASASPHTPPLQSSTCLSVSSPSTDRTISAHSWNAFEVQPHELHHLSSSSSSPESETILSSHSRPWTPSPALVAALRAADEQELWEIKEKVALLKMQLTWATNGGCDSDDLKGLLAGILTMEKRGRNLARTLGHRNDEYEDEDTQSEKEDVEDIDSFFASRPQSIIPTSGDMPEKLTKKQGFTQTEMESNGKHVHFDDVKVMKEYEKQRTAQSKRKARKFEDDDDDFVPNMSRLRGQKRKSGGRILPPSAK